MEHILYVVGWAAVFATTTPCFKVMKKRLDQEVLPVWLQGRKGEQRAFLAGLIAWSSAFSLLGWGALHLKWYLVIGEWVAGVVASGFTQEVVSPANLISIGPPVILSLNIVLWVGG